MVTKMISNPRVLVIIATLGQRTDYLELTLRSIRAQDYDSVDIVLVYPFKSIETKRLAKKYDAHSIEDPGSMSEAVNAGIRYAWDKYDYVTWIGDDDLLEPSMAKTSLTTLEHQPTASATFGHCRYIDGDGDEIFISRAGNLAPWIMTWGPNMVPLPGSMFRVSALKKLDFLFDPALKYAMDLDLFLRLRKIGPLVNVGQPVSSFRWHADSTTVANKRASLLEAEKVKRKHLGGIARTFAFLWEGPVRFASVIASKRISKSASK